MGAMVARGVEPVLKAFERLIAAGKPNKVASIAAARKLLIILSAIGHEGTPERDCGGSRAIHSEPQLGRSRPPEATGWRRRQDAVHPLGEECGSFGSVQKRLPSKTVAYFVMPRRRITPRHFGVLRVLAARNDGVLQMYISCGASNCSAARRVRPRSKPGQYNPGSNVASGCNRMPLQGYGNGLLWLFGCATSLRKSR